LNSPTRIHGFPNQVDIKFHGNCLKLIVCKIPKKVYFCNALKKYNIFLKLSFSIFSLVVSKNFPAIQIKNTIHHRMKKISSVLAFLAILTVLVSSCKTREKCPAYGQTEKVSPPHRG